MKYHQGIFKPKNPEKYLGNSENIFHRSGLEKRFFKFFDENENILKWGSEEFFIPYHNPYSDKTFNRYFVDICFVTKDGRKFVAEIKPYNQTTIPKKRKNTVKFIEECKTWEVNQAKWKAAENFCKERNINFIILTEKALPKIL